jgi:NitT/TauT family transport system ATP-binding protein
MSRDLNQPPALDVRGVSHAFGENRVLHDVCFSLPAGQICGFVGPSGSGKSTLLRAILSTHPPDAGTVHVDGHLADRPSRDRGMVYQRYTLFPFKTALGNVTLGPLLDQTSLTRRLLAFWTVLDLKRRHRAEAAALLERVGLGDALHRYPSELSGGMQQRVAVAQALILKPSILLLDEPFGALDEATREDLQDMLLGFAQENRLARQENRRPPYTMLIVTHELNEALLVSERVIGLSQYWRWEDEGHQRNPGATIVYDRPAPVLELGTPRDPEQFRAQRQEIRDAVFEPDVRPGRWDYVDKPIAAAG